MGGGGRMPAICCAPTSNSIGKIAAMRVSTTFSANCLRPSARICARSALRSREAGVDIRLADRKRHHRSPLGPVLRLLYGHGRPQMGHPYLTRDFFSRLGASLAHQILLVMAKSGGRIYRRRAQSVRRRHSVWPQLGRGRICPLPAFRDLLLPGDRFRHCARPEKVEAGAQGEHKLLRGYMPVETYSAHFIVHKGSGAGGG